MSKPQPSARKAAIYLLDQVLGQGRLMSELLGAGALDHLPPEDRARAQRLALDTLRGMERADRLLKPLLRKNPPLTARNILRLATVELAAGGDAHGVVNEAVTLTQGNRKTQHLKGMINAVLRKVATDGVARWHTYPVPRLPRWLRDPLTEAYGRPVIEAMEKAHYEGAPLDISVKSDAEVWSEKLGGDLLPTGSIRLRDAGQVSKLPGFDDGAWWVQDAAAAIPAKVANIRAGETVLDMCAAPGGKTLQLAAAGGQVTAVDISEGRMARVRENLERTKLSAEIVISDALQVQGSFDVILLDAPCSATGTIRRHPDLPYAKDGSEFMGLFALQEAMIDHALSALKPGGRLIYCTCSLLPDEGEVQIDEALARHPDVSVEPEAIRAVPGVEPEWITDEGGLRLRPDFWADAGGMDGFYVACLRKQ